MANGGDNHWHLDKKVPVAIILALIAHASTFMWWASDINARVTANEKLLEKRDVLEPRLARVEAIAKRIPAIDAKIDRLIELSLSRKASSQP